MSPPVTFLFTSNYVWQVLPSSGDIASVYLPAGHTQPRVARVGGAGLVWEVDDTEESVLKLGNLSHLGNYTSNSLWA